MPSNAMLMAAGLGTRLRPFTETQPKALLPLLGVPMAQFAVDLLADAGVQTIVANVHHLAERSEAGLKSLEWGPINLQVSNEKSLLLGSAGGIRNALPHFGSDPFFLVNADTLFDIDLHALAERHFWLKKKKNVLLTLALLQKNPSLEQYREIQLDSSRELIVGVGEKIASRPFYSGVAILEPEAIQHVSAKSPSDFVPMVLEPAIRANRLGAWITNGAWYDIGSPRLWLETHLALIKTLEDKTIPLSWSKRFQQKHHALQPGIWVPQHFSDLKAISEWKAPCFWSANAGTPPPHQLGPHAILYGECSSISPLSEGIGFGGQWVQLF